MKKTERGKDQSAERIVDLKLFPRAIMINSVKSKVEKKTTLTLVFFRMVVSAIQQIERKKV